MAWQGTFFAFALGCVTSLLVTSVHYAVRKMQERTNMQQSYQTSSFREEHQESSSRNIMRPFCYKCVNEKDHQLSCGHRCHRSCYQRRPAKNRNCTYCQDSNEGGTLSSTQSSRRSSISNDCCYCKFPISNAGGTINLNCKHTAHKECFIHYNDILQCQACNAERY